MSDNPETNPQPQPLPGSDPNQFAGQPSGQAADGSTEKLVGNSSNKYADQSADQPITTNTTAAADASSPYQYSQQSSPAPKKPRADRGGLALSIFRWFVFLLIAFIAGVFFTIFMQTRNLQGTPLEAVQKPILEWSGIPDDAQAQWLVMQQAFRLVDENFYQQSKINHKDMIYAAAEAAVASLGDRFTAFNRPQVAQANDDHITGKFVGLGVTPEIKDGNYVVKRIIPNSPIDKAGIKEGDYLVAINDIRVSTPITDPVAISNQLRGEVNTQVKVTFARPSDNNKETAYTLTREELIAPSVDAQMLDNNLLYIDMRQVFGSNTMAEFDQKVGALAKDKNPAGYILDLRGNGGGLTDTARALLGRFLNGGVAYYDDIPTQNIHMRPEDVTTSDTVKLFDKPMVVLTDGGTASASEITVGALHDRQRATIIGEKTYGKGVAQYVISLADKSALRVTFESWYTPNKTNMTETKGITPDIVVTPTDQQNQLGQDPQLDQAIQFLTK